MAATNTIRLIEAGADGRRLDRDEALGLVDAPLDPLMEAAAAQTVAGFGQSVTYSRKVFIPLTQLCRDVCHYCTFAKAPRRLAQPYMAPEDVLAVARAGQAQGCKEALFTLGDKPELRYAVARRALESKGMATTLDYLEQMAGLVFRETGLLPHLNPGVMERAELARLRTVSASMGVMLETASDRLSLRGGPHFGSPDKRPVRRLETIRAAGELAIPFTSGLLIGIGETRHERIESLLALRDLHDQYGHLQEIIIQNFRAKPDTKMHEAPEPALDEQLWTIAVTRLLFGSSLSVQAPPNLRRGALSDLIRAGVNDWGGVSPVTPDHVNPEAPWPQLAALAEETAAAGRQLTERLAIGPAYARAPARWVDAGMVTAVLRLTDSRGLARTGCMVCGRGARHCRPPPPVGSGRDRVWHTRRGRRPRRWRRRGRGTDYRSPSSRRCSPWRAATCSPCSTRPTACVPKPPATLSPMSSIATSTTRTSAAITAASAPSPRAAVRATLRGPAYDLDLEEIARRTVEAAQAGATEVCLQGGIHPRYTGETYLGIVEAVKTGRARHARPCVLAAGDPARRANARLDPHRLPHAPAARGPVDAAGHGCRDPR